MATPAKLKGGWSVVTHERPRLRRPRVWFGGCAISDFTGSVERGDPASEGNATAFPSLWVTNEPVVLAEG